MSKIGSTSGQYDTSEPARRRILVIDDSDVMLNRIRRALESEGWDVITTANAVGNARHIATCDLVIIDYHMPGIDGAAVISSLREAASANASRGAQSHGCVFYLYTSDPAVETTFQALGFDGVFTEKGDERALVR